MQSSYGNNIIIDDDGTTESRGFKWLTCNTECEWGGINCNENGLINATDFVKMKNNLTGTLPPEVVALPELSVFRLVRSTFSGTIPSPYSDLYWGLSGNLIDLSKMSRLKQLRLGQNRLGG